MFPLTIIVAATKSNGIGRNAGLPWRLPKEMKYFAQVTSNAPEGSSNAVIMGRNTWESIPEKYRPLPKRINIITSRNADYELKRSSNTTPAFLHPNFASALGQIGTADADDKPIHRTFIIGGASIYSESLALPPATSPGFVNRILLTRVLSPDFDCDVFMPTFIDDKAEDGRSMWIRATHEALEEWVGFTVPQGEQEEDGVKYEFQMWVR